MNVSIEKRNDAGSAAAAAADAFLTQTLPKYFLLRGSINEIRQLFCQMPPEAESLIVSVAEVLAR